MAKKKNVHNNGLKNNQKKAASLPIFLIAAGVLVLVAAAAAALMSGGSAASGSPRLAADREVIDFGEVKLGKTVTASFTLTNTGDAPLRFSEPPYVELIDGC